VSDSTKLILALTLGSVGLALGVLGTVVAFNTRSEVKSNQEIASVVEERFAKAQKRQDELEARRVSEAEKLLANLSTAEKNLLRKANGNATAVGALRRRLNSQEQQIQALKSTDQQLSSTLSSLQRQVQRNFNELTDEIDRLTQRVNRLQTGAAAP
jgi:chromosome segregation ATPase